MEGNGYCEDYSRSRNAAIAECDGEYPASVLAKKLGCKTGAIVAMMDPVARHHTSSWYNETSYYDGSLLLAYLAGDLEKEDAEHQIDLLARLRAWRGPKQIKRRLENCTVRWLDWSGTRNRPECTEREAAGVAVTLSGTMATIHLPTGDVRKRTSANGFSLIEKEKER